MKKTKYFRIMTFCLSVLMLITFVPKDVYAAPAVNTNYMVGVSINYEILDAKIDDAEFSLYKIASMESDGKFVATPQFENYAVELNGLDNEEMQYDANTLYGYIVKDHISPTDTTTTDSEGFGMFPNSVLLYPGMYLLTCKANQAYGEYCYIPPMLLSMPTLLNNRWIYNIEVSPKYSVVPSTTEVAAQIIWRDDSPDMRPESVKVQLINPGQMMSRSIPMMIALNEGNQWHYSWKDLPAASWYVVQTEVPEGYTVSTKREGNLFIFINTRYDWVDPDDIPEPEPEPSNPSKPSSGKGDKESAEEVKNPVEVHMAPSSGEKLPQTGTLWWPVPVLAVSGMIFILIGMIFRRKEE